MHRIGCCRRKRCGTSAFPSSPCVPYPIATATGDIFVFNSISDLSIESSGQSNSLIPDENFHHEEPLENNVPIPNHNNLIPVDVVDQFRRLNQEREVELFARIRLLENRLIEGLPPQLNLGEYEALVRGFLDDTLTIRHYSTTISNELFEIGVYELKADLLDQLFNLLMKETTDRLNQILTESPFPERAIRTEALEFIVDFLNQLNLNDPTSNFDKGVLNHTLRYWLQDVQQNGHQSAFYLRFLEHFKGSI
ncbi:Uncharacterized protein Adt_21400 [Abeliophyllum distichum]|uniref:Uncharacterized protein n=1 Tax=Abeliophyllum distichum TaxID=126358 RepID=A0ABD1SZ87_9LAMI